MAKSLKIMFPLSMKLVTIRYCTCVIE